MTAVSNAFKAALASGAPQRVALVFEDAVITNEDIDVEGGVDIREVFCPETDFAIGQTPASEITFAVFNDDGYYDELIAFLQKGMEENFLREEHLRTFAVASTPQEALDLAMSTPMWDSNVRRFAKL